MRYKIILIFFLLASLLPAQRVSDTTLNVPMVTISFGGQKPFGDLADRFGENLSAGGSFLFKHKKTWILGAEGSYFFGRNVREDILSQMKTSDNFIIDNEGFPADLRVTERGFNAYIMVGKVFP